MNQDDMELFGLTGKTKSNGFVFLVKNIKKMSMDKWTTYVVNEIEAHKFIKPSESFEYVQIYNIDGCKDYALVYVAKKEPLDAISEIRQIFKNLEREVNSWYKTGGPMTIINYRDIQIEIPVSNKEEFRQITKTLYASLWMHKKPKMVKRDAQHLTSLYDKALTQAAQYVAKGVKKPSTYTVYAVAVPCGVAPRSVHKPPKLRWDDHSSMRHKLEFLINAKLTPKSNTKKTEIKQSNFLIGNVPVTAMVKYSE